LHAALTCIKRGALYQEFAAGIFSAHTATHSTSGSAYETQSFSTELRKTKKVPTNT